MLHKNGTWNGWKPLTTEELELIEAYCFSCGHEGYNEFVRRDGVYDTGPSIKPDTGHIREGRLVATLRKREQQIIELSKEK